MLSLAKQILTKYKIVVIQMFNEQASHDITKSNLELFCDVEVFLGLTCNQDIFIRNFVAIVKKCEAQLYQMYRDQQTMYG